MDLNQNRHRNTPYRYPPSKPQREHLTMKNPTQIFRSTLLNILYYFFAALGIFVTTATATYFAYLYIVLILSQ